MKFGNVPTYSAAGLENRAREILAAQIPEIEVPVDIELLVERQPGVRLDYWPGLRPNHGIAGMTCRDIRDGQIYVFVDESIADGHLNFYRSTVAEEFGHVILHRELIEQVKTPADFKELQGHPKWHDMDRNAKRFAAACLMPGEHVIRYAEELYPMLVAVAGFSNIEAVQNQIISKLSRRFEVSTQSMNYRFTEFPLRLDRRIRQAMNDRLDYLGTS
jgi:hypothetical protein